MICQLIFLLISVVLFSAVTGENFPPIVQQTEFDSDVVQQTEFDSEDEFCECGISQEENVGRGESERIVSGSEVQPPYKYPWMVGLYKDHHRCGGSLITQTFVLTAAHCFLNDEMSFCPTEDGEEVPCFEDASLYKAGVSGKETTVNKFYEVKRYITHPEFNLIEKSNDIALIELQEPIGCSPYTRPICLPDEVPALPVETEVIVAGWGRTEDDPRSSKELLETKLRIKPKKFCERSNRRIKTHFCALELETGICVGDSGGPLFYAVNGKYYIFGVTSFKVRETCYKEPRPLRPDFFSDVKQALDWIHQTTNTFENIRSTPFPISYGNWTVF